MKKKKLILPMKFNAGMEKFEPDLERIKALGNSLKKKNSKRIENKN